MLTAYSPMGRPQCRYKKKNLDNRKLRNIKKNLKFIRRQSAVSSLPFKNKALVIATKNYGETDMKTFRSFPFLLDIPLSHEGFYL